VSVVDVWAVIAEERTSLADTFDGLTGDQWDVPSLCGHWTVRQVLGHLVIATDPPGRRFAVEVVKAFGSFDKANDRLALEQAERPAAELIADLRAQVPRRFTPPGLGPEAPLHDILLHSLDVRIPLGLPTERPAEHYAPALDIVFSAIGMRTLVPKRRPKLRWTATDHSWTHGEGDEVQGGMADLALSASGRAARVDAITGPGQPALAAWLAR
jgi:uncharacterized protein (TIGR03083 family)